MVVSVQAFADALFAREPVSPETAELEHEVLEEAMRLPRPLLKPFIAEFASLHLPAFLHLIRSNLGARSLTSTLMCFAMGLVDSLALSKWVRESTYQDGIELVKELMQRLDVNWPDSTMCSMGDFTLPFSDDAIVWMKLLNRYGDLFVTILRSIPRDPGLPSILSLTSSLVHVNLSQKLRPLCSSSLEESSRLEQNRSNVALPSLRLHFWNGGT